MLLCLGKNHYTGADFFVESRNVNFIMSPTGEGKTSLFMHILKGLSNLRIPIYACIDSSISFDRLNDLFPKTNARLCIMKSKEDVVSRLKTTLGQRIDYSNEKYGGIVFMFDGVSFNDEELWSILKYPNELLEELNIYIIATMCTRNEPCNINASSSENGGYYTFQSMCLKKINNSNAVHNSDLVLEVTIKDDYKSDASTNAISLPVFL